MSYPQRGIMALVLGRAGWLFGVSALLGLALAAGGLTQVRTGWALAVHGVVVTGQVSDKEITTRSCGKNHMDTCTDYVLGFDFKAAGVATHGTAKVGQSTYHGLTLNGPITVRYLPEDTAVTEVEQGTTLISGGALALIALAFLSLGGWGLRSGLRNARRMLWLREEGVVQRARVMSRFDTKTRINGVAMWRITWADAAGITSRSRLTRLANLPEVGSEITIYADPAGRLPSVWEGDCGTRAWSGG